MRETIRLTIEQHREGDCVYATALGFLDKCYTNLEGAIRILLLGG